MTGTQALLTRATAALAGEDPGACSALLEPLAQAQDALVAGLPAGAVELVALRRARGALLGRVVDLRLASVVRIHAALDRLRSCATVAELLPAAAQEMAFSCRLDRAAVSRLRGSAWRAEAVWLSPSLDPEVATATRDYMTQTWTPLSRGRLETELIRRRAAEVVDGSDPRVTRPLMEATGSTGYVASPVLASGRVIGFLQGDCLASGRMLTTHDRDDLWTFAEGFGLLFERTVLLERLGAQREQARAGFARAEAQLDEMAEEELHLTKEALPADSPVLAWTGDLLSPPGVAGLTAREREVVELLATGARNDEIADRLVIGSETVKSHIRAAMRKLGAASRSEAVARYLVRARDAGE